MRSGKRVSIRTEIGVAAGLTAALFMALLAMGQPAHCSCPSFAPWAADIWTSHNSQHLFDPYSFTHFSHGLLFFWGLTLAFPRWSTSWKFRATMVLEGLWELLENSPWVIEHYRQATVSLDYLGDSAVNSVGDMIACGLGFCLAASVPWWATLAVFLVLELALLFTIRDNLFLNVLNLVSDQPRIVEWQARLRPK